MNKEEYDSFFLVLTTLSQPLVFVLYIYIYISPDYTLIVESVLLGGVGIESSGIML